MTMQQENQSTDASQPKTNDKELNFRALEAKYKKELDNERQARQELERKLNQPQQDEDDPDEPYVAPKVLNKKLAKANQSTQQDIQKAMEMAKYSAKEELKQEMWLENNSDFYDILQHAEKFAEKAPKLAESILRMPEGFERQKLVYQNIKALGIDKPEQKTSVQDKIDANMRSPYYQPTGVGSAPYQTQGDYTPAGQKKAYEKLQELKKSLRI